MAGPALPGAAAPSVFTQSAGALNSAMAGTQANMGYQPMTATGMGYDPAQISGVGPIAAQNVTAGQIAGSNLGAYTNPYERQVVDQSLADLSRANQMAMQGLGAQASAARAFGGSRHGVAEAETNRAFADQAARMSAGLRQAGFNQALQSAQFDIGSAMQAALANQGANLQAGTTNAANMLQTQLANQGATSAARQFGAGAMNQASLANQQAGLAANQQRLGAAAEMGNLSNLGFNQGMAITNQQMQQGALQQALQQQLIDAARAQYGGFVGAPMNSLQAMLAAVGAGNMGQQSETKTRQPGLFDYLTLAATAFPRV
jgi:hypothetical protein